MKVGHKVRKIEFNVDAIWVVKPAPDPVPPPYLERLREPGLQKLPQFRCRLKLQNRIQFLEGRSKCVRNHGILKRSC